MGGEEGANVSCAEGNAYPAMRILLESLLSEAGQCLLYTLLVSHRNA
jgi:hypothetical protein